MGIFRRRTRIEGGTFRGRKRKKRTKKSSNKKMRRKSCLVYLPIELAQWWATHHHHHHQPNLVLYMPDVNGSGKKKKKKTKKYDRSISHTKSTVWPRIRRSLPRGSLGSLSLLLNAHITTNNFISPRLLFAFRLSMCFIQDENSLFPARGGVKNEDHHRRHF